MATLAVDTPRAYETNLDPVLNHLPVIAADIIYEGAAVGDNASGYARPLAAADPFLGFANKQVDNSGGAAGALNVEVRQQGIAQLTVVGAEDTDDVGEAVYASDDGTFTLTSTSNTVIGKVVRHVSGTTCMVWFQAHQLAHVVVDTIA